MASSCSSNHQVSSLSGSTHEPSPFFPVPVEDPGPAPGLVRSQTESSEGPPLPLPLWRAHTESSVYCAPAQRLVVRQAPAISAQSPAFGPLSTWSALPVPTPSPVNTVGWQVVGQRLATALNDPSLLASPAPSPHPSPLATYVRHAPPGLPNPHPSPLSTYIHHAPPGLMTPVHVGQWQQVGHRMVNLLGAATPAASPTNSFFMSPRSVASPMHSAAGQASASQNSNPYQQLLYSYGVFN
mmetsp:Transcript_105071/g.208876  ORF Transcript_105071/g.208876 Transcript_105071/m.208876 type:complete len:240 (+) Transcript_105071:70-789(+)